MRLIDIIAFLVIFNFVMTGLSALSLLSSPTYVSEDSQYDVSDYASTSVTELLWSQVSQNFLVSLGAGIIAGVLSNKLLGISGGIILSTSIFTGLITYGLIGTSNLLWNIYQSLQTSMKVGMGISLYMFFGIIGILIAISVIQLLSNKGVLSE